MPVNGNPKPPEPPDRPPDNREVTAPAWFLCLLLAFVTLAVFWPARHYDFLNVDDDRYVTGNYWVLHGLTGAGVWRAFTSLDCGFWQPLVWVSYMIDASVFGPGPGGFHFSNFVYHTAAALALFLALEALTGARWRSAVVAALFALHPLHVEPVAWISSRKDVLSALFAFLSIGCYARYAQVRAQAEGATGPGRQSIIRWYSLALLFFLAGLMCKTSIVTLPLLLLVLDWWPLRRIVFPVAQNRRTWVTLAVEKAPFLAAALAAGLLTFLAEDQVGALPRTAPLGLRLEIAVVSPVRYLMQTLWPAGLSVTYPYPRAIPPLTVAGAGLVLVAITVWVLNQWQRRPYLAGGWLWYWLILLPVSGLVQVGAQAYADRYTYVPLTGIFIILVWGANEVLSWLLKPRGREQTAWMASGLLILACALGARQQLRFWQDSGSLFRRAIAVTAGNSFAHYNLGQHLYFHGSPEEAAAEYREAIRIDPNDGQTWNNLGYYHFEKGGIDRAMECYRQALSINPRHAKALNNLGAAFLQRKQFPEARGCFEAALQAEPDFADAHINLAVILARLGDFQESLRHFQVALQLQPDNARAHNNLANILYAVGQVKEAIVEYRLALKYNPGLLEALNNLGLALAETGDFTGAVASYEAALQIKPDDADTHFDLGNALAAAGRREEAMKHFAEAVRLNPDFAEARSRLEALKSGNSPARAPGVTSP